MEKSIIYLGVKMKKAALHNLGCKVNAYETEAMQQMLEAAGYEIVPFNEPADVYVVNTCSVTNMADRKSRQMLHKAKKNIYNYSKYQKNKSLMDSETVSQSSSSTAAYHKNLFIVQNNEEV